MTNKLAPTTIGWASATLLLLSMIFETASASHSASGSHANETYWSNASQFGFSFQGPLFTSEDDVTQAVVDALISHAVSNGASPPIPECGVDVQVNSDWTYLGENYPLAPRAGHVDEKIIRIKWATAIDANGNCFPFYNLFGSPYSIYRVYDIVDPEFYLEPSEQDEMECTESNPCNPATGNKSQREDDYVVASAGGLSFTRYYNSKGPYNTARGMGAGWRHTYSRALDDEPDRIPNILIAAPVDQSAVFSSASDACTIGWDDIKDTVWSGDLAGATPSFAGGNVCKIESGGSPVAYFPVRSASGWNDFVAPTSIKTITRPSGASLKFEFNGSVWVSELNSSVSLTTSGSDWIFTDANDTQETYNSSGQLTKITYRDGKDEILEYGLTAAQGGDDDGTTLDRVTGPFGHSISFSYDANSRLDSVTTPDGIMQYAYDGENNLTSVTNPDLSTRQYHFEDVSLPNHLTGITDENNDRFATWEYDSAGRAILSKHAGDKELVQFAYNSDGSTTLSMGNGAVRNYVFSTEQGNRKVAMITGDDCSTCPDGHIADRTYNSNGFLDSVFDWNGNETQTIRNAVGLTETLIEAKGSTEERTTTTSWHSTYRIPTQIVSPKNTTDFTYDANGNVLTATISSGAQSRAWAVTYNSNGQPLTIDGPRTDISDVTTISYNSCTTGSECGQINTVTNALGQVTTYNSYDAAGRPTLLTDANGLQTAITYDWRGNVLAVVRTPTFGTARITTLAYDDVGQLVTLNTPNEIVLTFTYTAAHYLESVTDNLGNSIVYDYDAMGNLIDENVYNSGATLKRAMDYAYDLNNRLDSITDGGFLFDLSIDKVGNLVGETDPVLASTTNGYDALNRLGQITDALSGTTDFNYDDHDNLVSVDAPNGAMTIYEYDDLDNLTKENSPDRGAIVYTYDATGNRKSQLDARGKLTSYEYDALNRLTLVTFDDSSTISYDYDGTPNGIGRLTKIIDTSGTTEWTYDNFGAVTRKIQTIGAVALVTDYVYDSNGRLSTMTYPSGKVVSYSYNTYQMDGVSVDGSPIVTGATYEPFGPVNGWTWGNGSLSGRDFDLRGLATSVDFAGDTQTLEYDAAGRVTSQLDSLLDIGYDYDLLGRLTNFANSNGTDPAFTTMPVLLASIQTMNNEQGALPVEPSAPWMNVAVKNVTASGAKLSLERGQVNTGSIDVKEKIGYVAISATTGSSFVDSGGNTISYETQTTPAFIKGWSTGCFETAFVNTYASKPVVMASLNSHNGNDGGWLRRCKLNSNVLGLTVDEDLYGDSERKHNQAESAGIVAFSAAFDGLFTDDNGTWGMEVAKVTLPSTATVPAFSSIAFRQAYSTKPVVIVLPNKSGNNPASLRVRNVTKTGFEVVQVEPAPQNGTHNSMPIHYLAIETGEHTLPDGTRLIAGRKATKKQQHGSGVVGNEGWATVNFGGDSGGMASQAFSYDPNDNRSLLTADAVTYSYTNLLNSNRLLSTAGPVAKNFTYDAAGNITGDGVHTYGYDDRGRLVDVDTNAAIYAHNGQGQRVKKDNGTATLFAYDETGNVIGEYDASGAPLQESVWFNGAPVALLQDMNMYYIHTDHLGTPRIISDGDTIVWRWHSDPFGTSLTDEDVDGDGDTLTYNLRFPGQYFDSETGLHYNYFRTYDPSTGRYLESDPIGLWGGMNTYGYASQNPLMWTDPFGLDVTINVIRTGHTANSNTGVITATSDVTGASYVGDFLENRNPPNPNLPTPPGRYDAFVDKRKGRKDRVELLNVPKATDIQIHVGNKPSDLEGCFAPGTATGQSDWVSNSGNAMDQILDIIKQDGSGNIEVNIYNNDPNP